MLLINKKKDSKNKKVKALTTTQIYLKILVNSNAINQMSKHPQMPKKCFVWKSFLKSNNLFW